MITTEQTFKRSDPLEAERFMKQSQPLRGMASIDADAETETDIIRILS